ncbi:ABC transporter ATP-binding protein NatA [Andreprevotia sp. IGB-42]|uniref:ABC transporter ATP-binding protein n=1 Tax=Andreprevotia sp. IGB-42 TaxID=2497473 RepID=UPI00157ED114|nr:ATP-binding cassette domain-containing protein [Andreprevotia sp. IGB-42]KAF0813747.1 ABC transporter ATP-binding protein NatA [Andreprevotia sp. IGB-42]
MLIIADALCRDYQSPVPASNWRERIAHLVKPRLTVKRSVSDVSFSIAAGECVGLIGPNGAGKSTTIKMLTGILAPTSGCVTVDGFDPHAQRREYVKRIGVVFGQRSQLWWDLPVRESFRLLQAIFDVSDADFNARLDLFIERVGIDTLLDRPVRSLSLGQRMLCEIAAAFLHSPKVVFLDEPTIGLDIEMKAKIRELIRVLNREHGTTVLITSHDVGDIDRLCDRLIVIDQGKRRFDGALGEFKATAGDGRWWAVSLAAEQFALARAALAAHPGIGSVPMREREGWLEVAQHADLQFAELMRVLAPYGVTEFKQVEQDLEDLLHAFYTDMKREVPA